MQVAADEAAAGLAPGMALRFADAGILPVEELSSYGADDSRLEMSTLDTTPGVELIGGSAVGSAGFGWGGGLFV